MKNKPSVKKIINLQTNESELKFSFRESKDNILHENSALN